MRFSYLCAVVLLTVAVSCGPKDRYISITGFAQGGTYMVKLNTESVEDHFKAHPEDIKAGIDSILTDIDNSLSGYNKGSLLSKFNKGEAIVPDSIFMDIYNISYMLYESTRGGFDVAAGPLFEIWGFGFTEGEMPAEEEVEALKEECGMKLLKCNIKEAIKEDGSLNPRDLLINATRKSRLPQLNFNAIAQGYSCDLVARYLYGLGVKDMLVSIGGEIYCDGLNPSGVAWTVGVDKPVDGNDTPGAMIEGNVSSEGKACGIVTSGNYRKFYVKDGKKYAHTIDPRTGYPVSHSLLSATVIANDATTADAMATYCMVAGLEEAEKYINTRNDLEAYFIYDTGPLTDSLGTWSSK